MKKWTIGTYIIASAIIWGAVILGCAFTLRGTDCYSRIQLILSGGVAAHLVIIWAPTAMMFKKLKEGDSVNDKKE